MKDATTQNDLPPPPAAAKAIGMWLAILALGVGAWFSGLFNLQDEE